MTATIKSTEESFMRKKLGIYGILALGLAVLAPAACYAGDNEKEKVLPGPINSISDLQDTASLVFKLADTNNDNQISQQEATDAGNLIVGGFFFRADVNGDGVLTAQEAEQARQTLFSQQPLLKFVFERAKPTNVQPNAAQNVQPAAAGANDPRQLAQGLAADPLRTVNNLLDTNHDQKIEASELRQAVQMGVTTLFLMADGNQDGQLSMYELNAAVGEIAKSAVQSVFQAADADRNSMLSMEEYDKALIEPMHAVFRVLDANADNQLTLAELERAGQIITDQIQRLRVPEPPNSLANQLRSGGNANRQNQTPYQAAPQPAAPATTLAPR
jgi:Ca2+-binding EF-hand superfamily protein